MLYSGQQFCILQLQSRNGLSGHCKFFPHIVQKPHCDLPVVKLRVRTCRCDKAPQPPKERKGPTCRFAGLQERVNEQICGQTPVFVYMRNFVPPSCWGVSLCGRKLKIQRPPQSIIKVVGFRLQKIWLVSEYALIEAERCLPTPLFWSEL